VVNWKTTLAGAIAAMAPFVKSILPEGLAPIADAVQALALALLGYFAKDKNVTGVN
jgi:ActR/RegA family two-component response regulator